MKAIDNVLAFLKQNKSKELNTEQIAHGLNLSRSVVSGYLAKLYKQNKVNKSTTRPVVWTLSEKSLPFDEIIGHDSSLKESIELAKESILYPSNGLPVMITGRSGVGKSYLAKKIYEEAKALGVIDKNAPFVTLNTADYANNTELLSSVLFGYKKGAFTGADHDSEGLIDKANNGYLFLDEVHRLSKSNQEKLFSLIDNHTFYPLGEVENPHVAHIRLICATTEDLNKYMLKTFMRRIPVHIDIPPLIDRPAFERIEYVLNCFKQEAVNTKLKYLVHENTIIDLANQNYIGNLGTLQNRVKMLCSKSFAEEPSKIEVEIPSSDDSELIEIDKHLNVKELNIFKRSVKKIFQNIQNELIDAIKQNKVMSDFKLIIIKNLRDLKQFDKTIYFVNKVNMTLINKVQTIIKGIYGIDLNLSDDDVRNLTFAFRLSTFLDIKVQNNQEYYELLRNKYSRSFYVYRKFLERSNTELKDKSYLWFLLMMQNVINKVESIRYTSILLAHGTSTAESIQKVVNNLAGNYIFEAFDMPIEASVNDINKLVYKYLVEQKAREKGIILLFDMGSLNQMFTKIKHSLNKELLVVNNITTATALDIAMRVQRQENFNEIATKAENYGQYLGVQYFEGLSNKKNIIVSCLSGLGLSKAIKDIMEKSLSTTHQIFTMDYRKLHSYIDNNNEQFFKNTDLIMTTTDFKTNLDLPIVNIYDILDQKGFSKLRMYLQDMGEQDKNIDDVLEKFLKFLTIEGIKDRLNFLNPSMVIDEVETIVKKYEDYYNVQLSGKIKLNLYMHLSLMIERVLLNSDKQNMTNLFRDEKAKEFQSVSKTIFKPVEMKYNIVINDFEISLIYELIENYI